MVSYAGNSMQYDTSTWLPENTCTQLEETTPLYSSPLSALHPLCHNIP